MVEAGDEESRSVELLKTLRADIDMFKLVHPEKGSTKYLYYPDFRALLLFRLATWCFERSLLRPFAYALTVWNDLICGVWIGPRVQAGPGLFLGHPRGLVINPGTKIGKYCSILQRVTIGGPNVTIGDYVEINAGAAIISNARGKSKLTVGSHSIIGAGAVVVNDVPDCSVVVGVPGRVVKKITPVDDWVSFRKARNESGWETDDSSAR